MTDQVGSDVDHTSNEFGVDLREGRGGWEVRILDPKGAIAWTRFCGDMTTARTLASTIRQHIYWLSPGKFCEYYKIAEPR
jgi:hypothetical protein